MLYQWWKILEHPEREYPRVEGDGLNRLILRLWRSCFPDDAFGFAVFAGEDATSLVSIGIRLTDAPARPELIPVTSRVEVRREVLEPAFSDLINTRWPPAGKLPSVCIRMDGYSCGAARGEGDECTVRWSEEIAPREWDEWEDRFLTLYSLLREAHGL